MESKQLPFTSHYIVLRAVHRVKTRMNITNITGLVLKELQMANHTRSNGKLKCWKWSREKYQRKWLCYAAVGMWQCILSAPGGLKEGGTSITLNQIQNNRSIIKTHGQEKVLQKVLLWWHYESVSCGRVTFKSAQLQTCWTLTHTHLHTCWCQVDNQGMPLISHIWISLLMWKGPLCLWRLRKPPRWCHCDVISVI